MATCAALGGGLQFTDVVPFCEKMANNGKIVIVAALDGTFQRRAFNTVLDLVPLAESVTKLNAVCMMCCKDAPFSRRIDEHETAVQVIGGADKYLAVCRECYHRELKAPSGAQPTDDLKVEARQPQIKENVLRPVTRV